MLAAFPRGPPEWGGTQRQPQGLGCPFGGGEHSRTGLTSLDPTLKRTKRHCSVCHSVVKVTHSHYMCLTAMRRAGPRHQTLARKTHRDKPTERSPPQLPPPPGPPAVPPTCPSGFAHGWACRAGGALAWSHCPPHGEVAGALGRREGEGLPAPRWTAPGAPRPATRGARAAGLTQGLPLQGRLIEMYDEQLRVIGVN